MIPLKDHIDKYFDGNLNQFAIACGKTCWVISERVRRGNVVVHGGKQCEVIGKAPKKPIKAKSKKPPTMAGKFEKIMSKYSIARDDIEEDIIDISTGAGRYGSDDIYYNMPDGSVIIKRVIVDEWMEKK